MKIALAAALLFTLPAAAQPSPEPYRAVGTEPFWSLTIGARTIEYRPIEGRPLRVAKPRPIVGVNGELYRTRAMTVDITHVPCSDGMSDRRYPDTVRVTIGRRTLNGCGGGEPTGPGGGLGETGWRIVAIGERPVRLERAPVLRFDGERVSGTAGCNRVAGGYRFERGMLTAGPLAVTRMACPGDAMRVEAEVLRVMNAPMRARWSHDGATLTLGNRAGTLTLRRAP